MKKLILLIAVLLVSALSVCGQITKTESLFDKKWGKLSVIKIYDDNDVLNRYLFVLMFRDLQYEYIDDYFTPISGDAPTFYETLSAIIEFSEKYDREKGVQKRIDGILVSRDEIMGMFGTYINNPEGNGYTMIRTKDLIKFRDLFLKYVKNNNISLE